jgi:hypothetical protein
MRHITNNAKFGMPFGCNILFGLLWLTCLLTSSAVAQNTYYLPQIANGDGFKTTFVLFNNNSNAVTATLDLIDDNGNPLIMKVGESSNSRFVMQLPAGSTRMLETDGQGSLSSGVAKLSSSQKIGVSEILKVYDVDAVHFAETGIINAMPRSSFVLPVDTTGSFNTALAFFNTSSANATITLTLRDSAGKQFGSPASLTLGANKHIARYVYGPGQLFPSAANFQGSLFIQSSEPLASTALRENSYPLSYTSLSSLPTDSTEQTLYFPQVANGSFGAGSYKTSFLITNISKTPANVNLNLTDDNGKAINMTLIGQGKRSNFAFSNLASGASLFLQTDGLGSMVTGAAMITSDTPIGVSGIFTVLDSAGAFQTEAAVNCPTGLSSLTMPIEVAGVLDTGIAFQEINGLGASLNIQLVDENGAIVGSSVKMDLPAKGHLAKMVSELFPKISNFKGSITVSSTAEVAALTLRINSTPLSLTSLPVISSSSARFSMSDTVSDQAQSTTIAFSGLAMMTGNLAAQSFFPPGKVSDYFGFQYLRDNDPDDMGHNTSFLTRIANNLIYILNDTQLAQLASLATSQQSQIDLYGYKRFPLMQAFRRQLEGSIPAGSTGLNLNAVKQASRALYLLDGQMSFDRALLYANVLNSMDATQKAYLDTMKGKGWASWPDISDDLIRAKMQKLPQGTSVAVMTYASDIFSWYAGSVTADVYFCPERHGTYYGGFYIKDAPAVGHEGYSINEQLTATAGSALSDSSKGYVTATQAAAFNDLVDIQRENLYASPTSNIVAIRTQISTLLRNLITNTGAADVIKTQVLALSETYGELDGENNYHYATVIAQVFTTLSADQKAKLATLRKSIMSGTYSDGTPFDFSVSTTPFLYSSVINNSSLLASYINNTDYLFVEP